MAVYAIGDVQGCYEPLCRLLDKLRFDPTQDTLWFTGDLVNRGPQSHAVLALVHSLGARAVTVLGNHDLTLLSIAVGARQAGRKDTFSAIFAARDAEQLLTWLRQQPVLHHDSELGFTLVHAGLAPQWDLALAQACARQLEDALRGPDYTGFLGHMFGDLPNRWRDDLQGMERLRCITNIFTRLRFCTAQGSMSFTDKGPPGSQPPELIPWFQVPGRRSAGLNIVFGHWAALGCYRQAGIFALDSGCVWGGRLTALRLDKEQQGTFTSVPCAA